MAEQEITYIPYGLDEISQLDLMTNLANGVEGYLGSKRWAKKDKYRLAWINAYLDIINKGIVGASNDSGMWSINHNGDAIDLNTKSNIEKEMYLDAAYYIQLQMSKMTPRKKEEEKKKEDLNFYKDFNLSLLNYYGGNSQLFEDPEQGWDSQDARGTNGLRATTNRRAKMVEALKNYSNSLEEGKYNFEGTPFKDLTDAKTKIQAAIDALKTDTEQDDIPAFNALGLKYRAYFSNGGNDASTHLDSNGNPYTWNQWNENEKIRLETEAKNKAAAEKKALANNYGRLRFFGTNLFGKPLSPEKSNIQYLQGLAAKDTLNGDEQSELVGVFKLAAKNKALQNLTPEELKLFSNFGSAYTNPNRLKKINGLEGLYWDTVGNRIIKPYKNGVNPQNTSLQDILDLNNPELLELKRLELQNSKKLKDEDWDIIGADTVSMLGDIVSLGGGYAGVAGGITTILSDFYSDIRRGKNFKDVAGNLLKNTAWGIAGLIPGAKLVKLGKRAAQLYALYNSLGIIKDPDVHKSWKKLINGEDFTSHDFENLKWTLHAVTGVHNTARSHFSDNTLLKKLSKNQVVVETKNGKRTISTKLLKEINKAGGRGGQEAANKKFKEYTKEEAKEGSFEFNTEGRKWYNPTRYSLRLRSFTDNETKLEGTPTTASKTTIGRMLVQDRNKPIFANPFSSNTYKNWWTNGGPNRGYTTMALGKAYLNLNNTKQNISSNTNLVPEEQQSKKTWSDIEKGPKKWSLSTEAKEYREILKGNFSNNAILGGTHKIGNLTIDVDIPRPGATNGFAEVTFNNGSKQTIRFDNQKLLQKLIAEIVKERRVLVDSNGKKTKIDAKEMSKILKSLKAKGFLKQGGTLNTSYLDTIIKDFVNNNNI